MNLNIKVFADITFADWSHMDAPQTTGLDQEDSLFANVSTVNNNCGAIEFVADRE